MGVKSIPVLKTVEFVREVTETVTVDVPNKQLEFAKELGRTSVPLSSVDIAIAGDGTIEVNGIKACAYIKKQSNGIDRRSKESSYRYHLCNCKTIQSMIASGRKSRYVSTTRADGLFPVIDQSGLRAKERLLKLELCMNCKVLLESRNMLPNPFTLRAFFEKYQPEIPKALKRTEQVVKQERYAPNHQEIAERYKKQVKFICQLCGVNCKTEKCCLHLHHKDGDGQNNNASNLQILCADCHARQPMHNHMFRNQVFAKQINMIEKMRLSQNVFQLGKSD
jgi:hypothetical protein